MDDARPVPEDPGEGNHRGVVGGEGPGSEEDLDASARPPRREPLAEEGVRRDAGLFDDYPDPTATIGEAMLDGTMRPASGRVAATHLGVGLADVVFGAAIVRRAVALGLGSILER